MPQDPVMLLSFVNTKLRDEFSSLDAFCDEFSVNKKQIEEKLATIGYTYNVESNAFK